MGLEHLVGLEHLDPWQVGNPGSNPGVGASCSHLGVPEIEGPWFWVVEEEGVHSNRNSRHIPLRNHRDPLHNHRHNQHRNQWRKDPRIQ